MHYQLPKGWSWRHVVTQRVKWDIPDRLYPDAVVPGVCVGWGRPMDDNGNLIDVDE